MIGVYEWLNIVTEQRYIGSAVDVEKRRVQYLCYLRKGTSSCLKLQRAFDRYSENNLKFSVIEECILDDLVCKEQFWIDYFNSSVTGYNILAYAERRPEYRKLNAEEIDKINQRLRMGESQSDIAKDFNVHYSTISLVYRREPHLYSYALGKPREWVRGSLNNQAKLDENKVKEIKQLLAQGTSVYTIAARYGVGRTTIVAIKTGQNWAWV